MKAKDVRALSDKDLEKQLKDGRAELFNLRFQMATSQLDNTARVCAVKRDIARVQTEMRMRELAQEAEKKGAGKTKPTASKEAPQSKDKSTDKSTDTKDATSDSKKVAGA